MEDVLQIGGVDLRRLARAVGTPLLVYDEEALRKRMDQYAAAFRHPQLETQMVYAGKAFLCGAMVRLVDEAGWWLDVVSGGELACALRSGMPPQRILFHGNNKTPAELAAALDAGVGAVVVDNLPECRRLASLARQLRKPAAALLRVNPGVEAHTHRYIVTAHLDSKFGISMARREELYAALAELGASDYLTKPFHTQELLARIRAMTRTQAAQPDSRLQFGNVTLDRATFELSTPSGSFRLANKEYQMLELLMCNPHSLIPTERFLEKIWGYDSDATLNVVWVYISYLRKKLAALDATIQIKATRNAGYSLEETA